MERKEIRSSFFFFLSPFFLLVSLLLFKKNGILIFFFFNFVFLPRKNFDTWNAIARRNKEGGNFRRLDKKFPFSVLGFLFRGECFQQNDLDRHIVHRVSVQRQLDELLAGPLRILVPLQKLIRQGDGFLGRNHIPDWVIFCSFFFLQGKKG